MGKMGWHFAVSDTLEDHTRGMPFKQAACLSFSFLFASLGTWRFDVGTGSADAETICRNFYPVPFLGPTLTAQLCIGNSLREETLRFCSLGAEKTPLHVLRPILQLAGDNIWLRSVAF